MDPPGDGIGLQPEKLEEEKEGGPLLHCDLCDANVIYKIAQAFLPGLASACIDNTTGGLFKTPAAVAVDIRREMVDYLILRSENLVAESVVLEGFPDVEVSVDPYDIISDFVDDFVSSKRNFFSRVSGWLLSDKREDWIDDFVQEMEVNGFWLMNRRNTVAQTLLKNLDFRNIYHCNRNFKSIEDLEKHKSDCSFRTMTCSNEGCDSSFSVAQMEQHDSICPFKMLQCEQNCPNIIMRRDMDRHCITTCPMKLVKCPFYSVGCQSTIPQSTIEQHRSESLACHLLYVLQVLHKEASPEDLKDRANELEKISSPGRLISARDARSLTFAVKDLEAKLGPLKVKTNAKPDEEDKGLIDKKEEETDKPVKHVRFDGHPSEKEALVDLHSSDSDIEDSSNRNGDLMESSTNVNAPLLTNKEEVIASIPVQENVVELPVQREEGLGSPEKVDEQMGKSFAKEVVDPIEGENSASPVKCEEITESVAEEEKHAESTAENAVSNGSPSGEVSGGVDSTVEDDISIASPPGEVPNSVVAAISSEMLTESPPGEVSSSFNVAVKDETSIDSSPGEIPSSAFNSEMSTESPPREVSTTTVEDEIPSFENEVFESVDKEVGEESAPGEEEVDFLNSAKLRAADVEK
ncbi:hypothetical protein ACS0TY_034456 [Phlomoides rotata]